MKNLISKTKGGYQVVAVSDAGIVGLEIPDAAQEAVVTVEYRKSAAASGPTTTEPPKNGAPTQTVSSPSVGSNDAAEYGVAVIRYAKNGLDPVSDIGGIPAMGFAQIPLINRGEIENFKAVSLITGVSQILHIEFYEYLV